MTTLLLIWCSAHAPPEVDYLCGSALWSAVWFALGWLSCYFTAKFSGGPK